MPIGLKGKGVINLGGRGVVHKRPTVAIVRTMTFYGAINAGWGKLITVALGGGVLLNSSPGGGV